MPSNEFSSSDTIAPDLLAYLPLVRFIGVILGDETEVVLHDIRRLESSIVGIVNGHLSGRAVGGSATDLVLSIMAARRFSGQDYITDYESRSPSGQKYRSHTFFIRNSSAEIIGLICVNTDVRRLLQARELLTQMLRMEPLNGEPVSERLAATSTETADGLITRRIVERGLDPALMSQADKEQVVAQLDEDGLFLLKGTVAPVATALDVSESTVYRYLKNTRSRSTR
ncbi:MAG: PAS domain-containing protein [Propionibacteriaceae bacterium]|jgi:predicted transcriptional regulator YheO|nr:PAS domain-containing protein [Propionibacteriaceae bacterium]